MNRLSRSDGADAWRSGRTTWTTRRRKLPWAVRWHNFRLGHLSSLCLMGCLRNIAQLIGIRRRPPGIRRRPLSKGVIPVVGQVSRVAHRRHHTSSFGGLGCLRNSAELIWHPHRRRHLLAFTRRTLRKRVIPVVGQVFREVLFQYRLYHHRRNVILRMCRHHHHHHHYSRRWRLCDARCSK